MKSLFIGSSTIILVGVGLVILIICLVFAYLAWPTFETQVLGVPERLPPFDKGDLYIGETTDVQTIVDDRERDLYHFTGREGDRIQIRVDNASNIINSVTVYTICTERCEGEISNVYGNNDDTVISTVVLPRTGDFYILVVPTALGDYQLWLECADEEGCD